VIKSFYAAKNIPIDAFPEVSPTQVKIIVKANGMTPKEVEASIATFGLIPLLFATVPGSEIQRPFAIVVIGGLVSSTFLTLILLPILYQLFGGDNKQEISNG